MVWAREVVTDKHTNRQTDSSEIYIDALLKKGSIYYYIYCGVPGPSHVYVLYSILGVFNFHVNVSNMISS